MYDDSLRTYRYPQESGLSGGRQRYNKIHLDCKLKYHSLCALQYELFKTAKRTQLIFKKNFSFFLGGILYDPIPDIFNISDIVFLNIGAHYNHDKEVSIGIVIQQI